MKEKPSKKQKTSISKTEKSSESSFSLKKKNFSKSLKDPLFGESQKETQLSNLRALDLSNNEATDPYNFSNFGNKISAENFPVVKKTKKKKSESSKEPNSKITKDMNIAEIIEKYPDAKEKLMFLGLGCAGCHFAAFDTLENGANIHGMDVDELLEELND